MCGLSEVNDFLFFQVSHIFCSFLLMCGRYWIFPVAVHAVP